MKKKKHIRIDNSNNLKIFKLIFVFSFAILITCLADLSFGQNNAPESGIFNSIKNFDSVH